MQTVRFLEYVKQEVDKDTVQDKKPEMVTQTDVKEMKQELVSEVAKDLVEDRRPDEGEKMSSKEEQTTLASQDSMADAEELLYGEMEKIAAKSQATRTKATAPDDESTIYKVVLLLLAQVEAVAHADRVSPPFSQSPPSSATGLVQVHENPSPLP